MYNNEDGSQQQNQQSTNIHVSETLIKKIVNYSLMLKFINFVNTSPEVRWVDGGNIKNIVY